LTPGPFAPEVGATSVSAPQCWIKSGYREAESGLHPNVAAVWQTGHRGYTSRYNALSPLKLSRVPRVGRRSVAKSMCRRRGGSVNTTVIKRDVGCVAIDETQAGAQHGTRCGGVTRAPMVSRKSPRLSINPAVSSKTFWQKSSFLESRRQTHWNLRQTIEQTMAQVVRPK
jgi:hypothetical protein